MRKFRNTSSYEREKKYVRPSPFFVIVCEGSVTEVDYFQSFPYYEKLGDKSMSGQKHSHAAVYIEPKAGQYRHVIERAKQVYSRLNKKYGGISSKEVWCIFDCDNDKQRLNEAIQMAYANGFNPIYSIQCFELWFLLHFQILTTAIAKDEYDKRISKYLNIEYSHGTTGMYKLLKDYQTNALINSKRLWEKKIQIGEQRCDPITNVYELVEALNDAYDKLHK